MEQLYNHKKGNGLRRAPYTVIFNSSICIKFQAHLFRNWNRHSHFDCCVSATADHFICNKVDAVDLVGVTRQVDSQFVSLEIPDLMLEIKPVEPRKIPMESSP